MSASQCHSFDVPQRIATVPTPRVLYQKKTQLYRWNILPNPVVRYRVSGWRVVNFSDTVSFGKCVTMNSPCYDHVSHALVNPLSPPLVHISHNSRRVLKIRVRLLSLGLPLISHS